MSGRPSGVKIVGDYHPYSRFHGAVGWLSATPRLPQHGQLNSAANRKIASRPIVIWKRIALDEERGIPGIAATISIARHGAADCLERL